MMYTELAQKLIDILGLERLTVAIKWSVREPRNVEKETGKSRFCGKLQKAMNGEIFYSTVEEEECGGGMKHSGMKEPKELPANMRSGSFLIPRGVFKNIPAFQRAATHNQAIEAGIFQAVIFAPLTKVDFEPDVIFIVCNAKQGMDILHANAYDSGSQGLGSGAGPICSTMAAKPYLTGEVTYGFADTGARNFMDIRPDEVMVSIPASDLERIISNLEEMSTKR
ncbi:MAG: DUF169 domain-containing protein [Methanobacterium sp.]